MIALPDVITRLVALFDSATSVPVYDSTTAQAVDEWQCVIVGGGLDPSEVDEAARLNLADAGNRWTTETGSVDCVVSASSAESYAAARPLALGLFETCRAAVLADRTLGGLLTQGGFAEVSEGRLLSSPDANGYTSAVSFTVTYTTTLTT